MNTKSWSRTATIGIFFLCFWTGASSLTANPHWDPKIVPQVDDGFWNNHGDDGTPMDVVQMRREAMPMLRFRIDWDSANETFSLARVVRELSGTAALILRSKKEDSLGSYKAVLYDKETGLPLAHDSIGTGSYYRTLTRAITFRFPDPGTPAIIVVKAENPRTGVVEEVLRRDLSDVTIEDATYPDVEVRLLRSAVSEPKLIVNVYAEGYTSDRRAAFWADAARIPTAFSQYGFPDLDHLEFRAVFLPSNLALGSASNLGHPIPERDSALGLYFPYWSTLQRWYHVIYPTREERYRAAIAAAPYDYPIALVDSSAYWGVGNYREHTAIPSRNGSFVYLLMHEFGHYLGLNEEYEGGGATELQFAPGIDEPWSQNITFLRDPLSLKWAEFTSSTTPIPTPRNRWNGAGPFGAYQGGYADSQPRGRSHKPGFSCTMSSGNVFCPICSGGIENRIDFDLGN